ncbi:TPR domain hypothetical protein [Sorangium cellulosum So ce56]|uniref:PEGA domain-containing protein n=1 Tax=Sorangium cellulosum (strain So ce56) TaxID=448385 RepID=A9G397_SORC5|nr:bacterial transcriptional activator domain-containing protein [Sorangium cellulosum]CAN95738.1 TPR domain hypothetical protein [Sorangium cellulosum So ce56]
MPRGALPKIPCCSRPRGLTSALAALSLSLAPAGGQAGEPGPAQSDTAQTSPNLAQANLGQASPNPGRLNPGQAKPNLGQPNPGQAKPNLGQPNLGQPTLEQPRPDPGQPGGHKEQVLALYQAATRLLEAGRIAEACAMLEQGRTLDPTALNLLLRLGECLARTGRTAGAWNVFSETAAIAKSAGDPRAARAAALAAALEPRLSRMAIAVLPGSAAPGLEIRRNGVLLLPSQWGQALPVDPGTHTIEAQAPGRKRWSVERVVPADGASVVIDVPLLLAQEPPPRALAAAPKGQRTQAPPVLPIDDRGGGAGAGRAQRVIALASGGAGLVGLGLGAVFGAEAIARRDASNRGHCDARSRCDAVGVSLREDAQEAGTASTIAFSTGTAALLAAGLLLWTAPPSAAGPPSRRATAAAAAGPGGFSLVVGGSY